MTVDYDGVIVGGTWQGREAAAIAAREGARIALVEAPGAVEAQLYRQLWLQQLAVAGASARGNRGWAPVDGSLLGARVTRATALAATALAPEQLVVSGVDVVEGPGQFRVQPRLIFATPARPLRARRFLLCLGTQVTVPAIPGLAETPYQTVDSLAYSPTLPKDVVILGRSPEAIALALALAGLGSQVTLVSRGDRLVPTEDRDMSRFIESLLRAAGVTLHLGVRVDQITHQQGVTLWLSPGARVEAAHLVLATGRQPAGAELNLKAVGIRSNPHALPVDDRLRTTHSRVFACGPALGGYWAETTDCQDIPIALRNALYLPLRQLSQLNRLSWLPTVPAFVRMGLTTTQAQHWYGADAQVVQVPWGDVIAPHLEGDITGFCRWVVHRDGRLLGAQLCGPQAKELGAALALMLSHQGRIQHLERLPYLPYTHGELLHRLAVAWQQQRWQPGTWRRDWAENWFNWRRSRPYS